MPITRAYEQASQPGNFFVAGKNKIINGDFAINQRGFTSNTSSLSFNFDRWLQANGGSGTLTLTPQTFTPGTAPVSGYESANFLRCVTANGTTAGTFMEIAQRIEDVRTFAGQTMTVSFWAKAASGTPSLSVELEQAFGSGGSGTVLIAGGKQTISTSWARYSYTIAVPSISGKTIGTGSSLAVAIWLSGGSDFNSRTNSIGLQNNTFDIWGVQAEAGSVATPFQTATGTLAGELAACQRYYFRSQDRGQFGSYTDGYAQSSTIGWFTVPLPVTMRIKPSSIDWSTIRILRHGVAGYDVTTLNLDANSSTNQAGVLQAIVASGLGTGEGYTLGNAGSTAGYIGFSAEL